MWARAWEVWWRRLLEVVRWVIIGSKGGWMVHEELGCCKGDQDGARWSHHRLPQFSSPNHRDKCSHFIDAVAHSERVSTLQSPQGP